MATKKNTAKKNTAKKNTAKKNTAKSWSDISGDMVVFGREVEYGKGKNKNTFISYSTSVGRKDENTGEYDNVYFNVFFKKDEDIGEEGRTAIKVKKGFLTVSVGKNGDTYPAIMILDYTLNEDDEDGEDDEDDEDNEDDQPQWVDLNADDDLPF